MVGGEDGALGSQGAQAPGRARVGLLPGLPGQVLGLAARQQAPLVGLEKDLDGTAPGLGPGRDRVLDGAGAGPRGAGGLLGGH